MPSVPSPGKRLSNNSRVHLPNEQYIHRTHDEMCDLATQVERTGVSVQGIMNSSPLSHIVGFHLVDNIPVDYMHVGPEGVVKRMMNCWLKTSNHTKAYYINDDRRVGEVHEEAKEENSIITKHETQKPSSTSYAFVYF